MGYRTAWTNGTAAKPLLISVSPLQNDFLVGIFVNDAVGNNMVWPPGWTERGKVTLTTNSQDFWIGTYGPCCGTETGWVFQDDSSVSTMIGIIVACVQDTQNPIDTVWTGSTDSNQASPWTQDVAITPSFDGETFIAALGSDIVPPAVSYVVTVSATDSGGVMTWTDGEHVDDPIGGASSGFEHAGYARAFQATKANVTVTLKGTSSPSTSSGRAAIIIGLRQAPTNITARPVNQTVNEGQTATFSVTTQARAGSVTYQWQNNTGAGWNDVGGATSSSYTTPTTAASDNGTGYRVKTTDDEGTVTSDSAVLIVQSAGDPWTYKA